MTPRIAFPRLAGLAGILISGFWSARADILINEAHVDPPGVVNSVEGDGNYEYVELISTSGGIEDTDGLWLLQVDVRGGRIGVVKEAWDLGGLATGANGLLLLGDGYDTGDGGPWSGFKANLTAAGDPPGFGGDTLKDNDAFCLLLVRHFTGVEEVGNVPGTDIDHNDDGVLSVETGVLPWAGAASTGLAGVLDSVGFGDRSERPAKPPLTPANLTRQGYDPDNISRRPGDFTPNSAAAWYGGMVAGTSLTGVAFGPTSHFGLNDGGGAPAPGEATPGYANHAVAPPAPVFRINEVSLNPPGPDGNAEYIELVSTNRGHASLEGLTLVLLDSNNEPSRFLGTGTVGEIAEAWSLAGLATGANGLLLLGDAYSRRATPWGALVHPDTSVADPPGMGPGDIGDDNGFTLLLVRGFNGITASESSAGSDVDANDDGLVDAPRWTEVVDDIGFNQVDILNPIAAGLGRTYAGARVTTVPAYNPDHLSRRLGANEARATEVWYGGEFGGNSPLAIGLRTDPARPVFGGFKGEATPGAPNLSTPRSSAGVLINEVNFNPVEAPDPTVQNEEFIELIDPGLGITGQHGLTLLVVDTARPSIGEIKEAFDLSGLSTGPNGLLLLGDAYDLGTPYGAEVSVATNRENPPGFGVGDLKDEKAGLTLLIVRNLTAARGHDLDPDDDGTFNSTPWAEVLDGVGFGAVNDPAVVTLPVTGSIRTFARHHADLSRTAAAWHGGGFGSTGSMLAYGESRFGVAYRSAASPGRYNHMAEPVAQSPLLNELLVAAPRGTVENTEFIELVHPSGRSVSTNGFSLLLVDSSAGSTSTGNVGRILEAWSLDGLSTGTNGLLLLGDGYGRGQDPWRDEQAPAAATRLADPAGLDARDLGRIGDNGAFSLLLVKSFDGLGSVDKFANVYNPLTVGIL